MEPRIQYAKTSDGVNIAFATAGDGPPLVVMQALGFAHAELVWEAFANIMQPLASNFRTVWYDARGTGLSDRDAIDFSIEAMVRDFEAVVAGIGFDSFVLAAWTSAAPVAVTYATEHPESVSRLILCDGWARFSDYSQTPAYQAFVQLRDTDWKILTEATLEALWAVEDPAYGRRFAEFLRACVEPEAFRAAFDAQPGYDVTALLPKIIAATLVVHNKNNPWFPTAVGQRIAADIPNARLVLIDDITYSPVPKLIEEFVLAEHGREQPPATLPSGTAIVLFVDIVDSTVLTERLGDAAFREKARAVAAALRSIIAEHGGRTIEGPTLGDGVLATFASARQAIGAALACGEAGAGAGMPLHLGLHAGDVIREADPDGRANVYGGAVNIAARISGLSAPGEVLVSETVRSLARTSAGVAFEDRGEQALKGVGEAVRVWAVVER